MTAPDDLMTTDRYLVAAFYCFNPWEEKTVAKLMEDLDSIGLNQRETSLI